MKFATLFGLRQTALSRPLIFLFFYTKVSRDTWKPHPGCLVGGSPLRVYTVIKTPNCRVTADTN